MNRYFLEPKKTIYYKPQGGGFNRNSFRPVKKIGQGSQGMVNLVLNEQSGETLIKKMVNIVKKSKFHNNGVKSEVEILHYLKSLPYHDNIVHIVDIVKESEYEASIYMKNKCGVAINVLIDSMVNYENENRFILSPIFQKNIIKQILDGLQFIHKYSILHCDIKTDNIILTNTGLIKIIDFGVSMIKSDDNFVGRIGTLYCTAPEICANEVIIEANFGKSDIWGLGFIIADMIGNISKEIHNIINNRELGKRINCDSIYNKYLVYGLLCKSIFSNFDIKLNIDSVDIFEEISIMQEILYETLEDDEKKILEIMDKCLIIDQNMRPTAKELFELLN